MKHLPNAVTILRIALTPIFILLLLTGGFGGRLAALIIFVVAAASDWLDGKLARHYKVRSRLGHFLDPLADKVLVLGTFLVLAFLIPSVIPWWAVALIIVRDLVITLIRTYGERRNRPIPTLRSAKTKTLSQLAFLILVLMLLVGERMPGQIGAISNDILFGPVTYLLMLAVVALTVITGAFYVIMWFRMAKVAN